MRKKRLIICANGGKKVGVGHIFRTLALARYLKTHLAYSILYVINPDPVIHRILNRYHIPYLSLGHLPLNPFQVRQIVQRRLGKLKAVCLIDSKKDVTATILAFKKANTPVILADNSTQARLQADINWYPTVIERYKSFLWNGYRGTLIGGKNWIPISEDFIRVRSRLPSFEKRNHILVTFGGSDFNQLTLKVMNALKDLATHIPIDIVLGFSFSFKEKVFALNRKYKNPFHLHTDSWQMPRLMSQAGLAITALGTTLYELAFLGVPTIVMSNYYQDKKDQVKLKKGGYFYPIGYFKNIKEKDILKTVQSLWVKKKDRIKKSSAGFRLMDGKGLSRIGKMLEAIRVR